MRVGILVLSIGNFGQKGYYNMQEVGHAKALDKLCEEVIVYKLVPNTQKAVVERIEGCKNASIHFLPARQVGSNGLLNVSCLDKSLDALLLCADTQIAVPAVDKWARKNNVVLIPYVGVTESHSTNRIKRIVIDTLFQRNLNVFKKHCCAAKTPTVKNSLESMGVEKVFVAPVGLDLDLLNKEYSQSEPDTLKKKYGYDQHDKILLFIGRFIDEKRPVDMIRYFTKAHQMDKNFRLLMVGTGDLRIAAEEAAKEQGVADCVRFMDRIPNKDIWELYRIADCFVNLNQQEIFGMAILEAMYYGCKVVAWKAPGPSFIIEDGVSGCLADSDDGILKAILEENILPQAAHRRVLDHFTWDKTAEKILTLVK